MYGELEQAVLKLDSKERFRDFILGSLVDGRDKFGLISRHGMGGDDIGYVYNYLTRGISEIGDEDLEPRKKAFVKELLITRTGLFEEAALSLILDVGSFFTKTKFGNPDTPSEFVGTMLVSDLLHAHHDSPNRTSGKLAERVMQHIEYDAILRGDIRFGNQRYLYNTSLLGLLFNTQTENIPGLEYWKALQRNEDFIIFTYHALKELNDPSARQLLPRVIAAHHKNFGNEPSRHKQFWANLWFYGLVKKEFGDAYSQFLDDPSNEYQTTIRAITDTPIKKAPEVITSIDGHVLLLRSYKPINGVAEIEVVYIDDKIQEYSLRTNPKSPEFGKEVPSQLHNPLAKMVEGFNKFRIQYLTHLSSVKAKR